MVVMFQLEIWPRFFQPTNPKKYSRPIFIQAADETMVGLPMTKQTHAQNVRNAGFIMGAVFLGLVFFRAAAGAVELSPDAAAVARRNIDESGFAERIRPLVESAAAGTITLEDQTLLERLLMGCWREKLDLTEPRVAESILLLKQHPVAGELLRAMERWLHRPGGSSAAEINPLLEPYRNAPEKTVTVEGPA